MVEFPTRRIILSEVSLYSDTCFLQVILVLHTVIKNQFFLLFWQVDRQATRNNNNLNDTDNGYVSEITMQCIVFLATKEDLFII